MTLLKNLQAIMLILSNMALPKTSNHTAHFEQYGLPKKPQTIMLILSSMVLPKNPQTILLKMSIMVENKRGR
jgi:hypothetical protein